MLNSIIYIFCINYDKEKTSHIHLKNKHAYRHTHVYTYLYPRHHTHCRITSEISSINPSSLHIHHSLTQSLTDPHISTSIFITIFVSPTIRRCSLEKGPSQFSKNWKRRLPKEGSERFRILNQALAFHHRFSIHIHPLSLFHSPSWTMMWSWTPAPDDGRIHFPFQNFSICKWIEEIDLGQFYW